MSQFGYVASPDNEYSDIDVNNDANDMFSYDDANFSRSIDDSDDDLDDGERDDNGTPSDVHVRHLLIFRTFVTHANVLADSSRRAQCGVSAKAEATR